MGNTETTQTTTAQTATPTQTVQTATTPENNSGGSAPNGSADSSGLLTAEQSAQDSKPGAESSDPAKLKADDKPADSKDAKADDAKADESKTEPTQLADFTAPEGVKLDPEAAGEFKAIAQELGLKQEDAQKVADIGAKLAQKWASNQVEQVRLAGETWAQSSKTDKEFGGDKFAENLSVAKQALDTFGSPELKAMLKESKLENHPEVIRMLYRAGKQLSQDKFVPGGRPTTTGKDAASVLYPNQK